MRDKNFPISGPFIIEKALQFAKALGYDEFRGSNGWLEKFKRRHGIMAKVISDESKDVDDNDSENLIMETLSKILKDYKSENIFNVDETAIYFQCLSQKTLTFKNEKYFGGKQSKPRKTVMLGANMTGHQKLKLLVIGRSKNPRCFTKGSKISGGLFMDFNKKSDDNESAEKNIQKLRINCMIAVEVVKLPRFCQNFHQREIQLKLKKCQSFLIYQQTLYQTVLMTKVENFQSMTIVR
ncbi:Tigger transposable element-derived protein 4 [Araneus ventricosus]|uniref:Tigger transposable element-derived protein 4 n=1 Tax=Araneus ventricosus TaxID=182803 RepID=A0A4Y2IL33_ARAVE|nr:Tigger transposable element-derived protein 4 [Araneus ventricosus]